MYCRFSYGKRGHKVIGVKASSYNKITTLSNKHYEKICNAMGVGLTYNEDELYDAIMYRYEDEASVLEMNGYDGLTTADLMGVV